MERILSKEEIAELLSAVKNGEVETEPEKVELPTEEKTVSRLDLVKMPGSSRWNMPNLDIIFEAYGRNYSISLANRLQLPVSIRSSSIESMEFASFLKSTPRNSAIAILSLEPLKSAGLLVFDDALCFLFMEVLLGGGSGRINPVTLDRPMTAIEMNLIRGVMLDSCGDLAKAFDPLVKLTPSLAKVENNPRMANIVPADSGVLVARHEIVIEGFTGKMSIVIPHSALDPLRDKLREKVIAVSNQKNNTWLSHILQEVPEVDTEISAQMGATQLTVRDILNFQVGDIIDFGLVPNGTLQVMVEGKPKFTGLAGIRNGNKAIRIVGRAKNS